MNAINFFIGIGMAAGSVLMKSVESIAGFIGNFAGEVLGASSEFLGDGAQGFLGNLADRLKEHRARKELAKALRQHREDDYNEICKKIFAELNGKEEDYSRKNSPKGEKRELRRDARVVAELSTQILFDIDFRATLIKRSPTFETLEKEKDPLADVFIELFEETVKAYNEYKFHKIGDPDFKLVTSLIVTSLKDYIKETNLENQKALTETMISFMANQNGGIVNFREVALSRYEPKYILNACPQCGYCGDRIYTDERTNRVSCAACGANYSILQSCEPELLEEVNKEIKKIKEGTDELKGDTGEIKKILTEFSEKSDASEEKAEKILTKILEQAATKEYLDKCFSEQREALSRMRRDPNELKTFLESAFSSLNRQLIDISEKNADRLEDLRDTGGEVLKSLETLNENAIRQNEYLGQSLDSIGKQVDMVYRYAMREFGDLGEKSDLILKFVGTLCTKEYFEDKSNALGADLKQAIEISEKTMHGVEAITTTGITQILSGIDQLKDRVFSDGKLDVDRLEREIRSENAQLSGKIVGLQNLIEQGTAENRAFFRTIIKMQEEHTAILMANVGQLQKEDFAKIYHGRLPSYLLYNDGLGGEFPCPYCGAIEDRRLNNDDYCRCSACGNRFLGVNPFVPTEYLEGEKDIWSLLLHKYGRDEKDELLATTERTEGWRKVRTAKMNGEVLKKPDRGLKQVILPKEIGESLESNPFFLDFHGTEALFIPANVERIHDDFFTKCFPLLEKVIFQCRYEEGKGFRDSSEFEEDAIRVGKNVEIYGINFLKHAIGRKT